MSISYINICSLTIAFITFATPSLPSDFKTYPASACILQYPWETDQIIYVPAYVETVIGTDTGARIVCPIVRDQVNNATGISVIVSVSGDGNPNWPVICSLWSNSLTGKDVDVDGASTTNEHPTFLTLRVKSTPDGYYSINCRLPKAAKLYGYRVAELEFVEEDPTDDE